MVGLCQNSEQSVSGVEQVARPAEWERRDARRLTRAARKSLSPPVSVLGRTRTQLVLTQWALCAGRSERDWWARQFGRMGME